MGSHLDKRNPHRLSRSLVVANLFECIASECKLQFVALTRRETEVTRRRKGREERFTLGDLWRSLEFEIV